MYFHTMLIEQIEMKHQNLFVGLFTLIICTGLSESFRYYNTYRSYRYYYGNNLDYGYYRYHSYYGSYRSRYYYNGYSTSSDKGKIAGGVIGGLFGVFILGLCFYYCFVYRVRRLRGVRRNTTDPVVSTISTTETGNAIMSYNNTAGAVSFKEPPPSYESSVSGTLEGKTEDNVDTRSKSNLVENEVVQ